MVLKLDPTTPNVSCNVGIAHYALGDDAEGRQIFNTCHQKLTNPHTRGYYEAEVRRVLCTRQLRGNGSEEYNSDARERTPLDREREYQRNVSDEPQEFRVQRPRRNLPER